MDVELSGIAPEKVAVLRSIVSLYEEIAVARGRRYADAALQAMHDAAHAGVLDRATSDAELMAWLRDRHAALMAE